MNEGWDPAMLPPEGPEPLHPAAEPSEHAEAFERLAPEPISVGRAAGAAFALIFAANIMVAIGLVLGQLGPATAWPEWAYALLLVGMILLGYAIGLFVGWLLTRRPGVSFGRMYGFRRIGAAALGLAVVAALGGRFLGVVWGVLVQSTGVKLPGMDVDPTKLLPSDTGGIVLAFLAFSLLAPIAEEVVFRGMLFSALSQRMRMRSANIVSSLAFAALHFNVFIAVPVFFASLLFGWSFARSRTLWAPIAAHCLFNGLGLVAVYALKGIVPA